MFNFFSGKSKSKSKVEPVDPRITNSQEMFKGFNVVKYQQEGKDLYFINHARADVATGLCDALNSRNSEHLKRTLSLGQGSDGGIGVSLTAEELINLSHARPSPNLTDRDFMPEIITQKKAEDLFPGLAVDSKLIPGVGVECALRYQDNSIINELSSELTKNGITHQTVQEGNKSSIILSMSEVNQCKDKNFMFSAHQHLLARRFPGFEIKMEKGTETGLGKVRGVPYTYYSIQSDDKWLTKQVKGAVNEIYSLKISDDSKIIVKESEVDGLCAGFAKGETLSLENSVVRKQICRDAFPGFTVTQGVDRSSGTNNYIIEHADKSVMDDLSHKLASAEIGIKGGSGQPKYVNDHLKNGKFGIILTDSNIDTIIASQKKDSPNPPVKISAAMLICEKMFPGFKISSAMGDLSCFIEHQNEKEANDLLAKLLEIPGVGRTSRGGHESVNQTHSGTYGFSLSVYDVNTVQEAIKDNVITLDGSSSYRSPGRK